MFTAMLIFLALVACWWLLVALSPAQRHLRRFLYHSHTSPDALNGGFPGDDVSAPARPDPDPWPSVVVIVPGRNEGHILERTLGSLCAMDYPRFRVVFIDDQSTDNTASVCRELEARFRHLTVIHNTEHPRDGWIGKTWAVHQAEPHMHESDYLLFTDSDLEYHPACLRQMIRLARHRNADIASLLPSIRYETVGELVGLSAAMCIINTKLSLYRCNNPRYPLALVAGGFLLARRAAYEAIGGHASVRGQMIEDVALGKRAKAQGKRVFTALTHNLYTARMYEGTRDTFRGLKKNAYAGANYHLPFGVVIAAFLLFFGALTPLYLLLSAARAVIDPTGSSYLLLLFSTFALLFQWLVGMQTARYVGWPLRTAFLLPAGFAFYFVVFVGSVVDHYRGGNSWAGRRLTNVQKLAEAHK